MRDGKVGDVLRLSLAVVWLALASPVLVAQSRAIPIDPVTGILRAFETHRVVALAEGGHGNEQGHAFRVALISDPRFAAVVDDILVEFGNARYQDVIDRFVRGDEVPDAELRRVWQDTTQRGTVWDRPIYEAFYRSVRDANRKASGGRKLRVLLGDTPTDWEAPAGSRGVLRSDAFPAHVIQQEVLAKNRRVLVVFGGMHLTRTRWPFVLPEGEPALAKIVAVLVDQFKQGSIVTQLERAGTPVFVIAAPADVDLTTMQPDIAGWKRPSLAIIRDTPLGLASSLSFLSYSAPVIRGRDGVAHELKPDTANAPPIQDVADAFLYLGPPSSITHSRLTAALCSDPDYVSMRTARLAEVSTPARDATAAFKAECAAVLKK
jgi:hypothetical protein